jgi:alkanesulfonate monooxygenase SsuD/methylene tetrahydromethanopterin reductase-like flavin-dependent oxidoreductase (luciferase family)
MVRPACAIDRIEENTMKFGNLYWQQTRDWSYSIPDRVREGIELAVLSEKHGFDNAWFAEQHFHNYGISPNPVAIAQYVASKTTKIRVGTSIVTLPLWNPIRLAEDVALADILSDGRFDLGVGRGYQHLGFRGMNIALDERQSYFDEVLQIILDSWLTDDLRFEGKHFTYTEGVNVLPKPVQQPHPPIWFAVTSDDNIRYVAKTNFRVFGSANWGNTEQSKRDHELYKSERAKAGLDGDHWTYAINRQTYVIPKSANWKAEKDDFEDRARYTIRMGRGLRYDRNTYDHGYMTAPPLDNEEDSEALFKRIIFGYADEVADQILGLNSALGIDMYMMQNDFGGISHKKALESQELFGTEVIPAIRKATNAEATA